MCPPLALPATPPLQQGPCRQVHRRRGWHVAQPLGGGGEEREKSSSRIKNCLSEGIFLHLPTPRERERQRALLYLSIRGYVTRVLASLRISLSGSASAWLRLEQARFAKSTSRVLAVQPLSRRRGVSSSSAVSAPGGSSTSASFVRIGSEKRQERGWEWVGRGARVGAGAGRRPARQIRLRQQAREQRTEATVQPYASQRLHIRPASPELSGYPHGQDTPGLKPPGPAPAPGPGRIPRVPVCGRPSAAGRVAGWPRAGGGQRWD
jgi:hypothetical protein